MTNRIPAATAHDRRHDDPQHVGEHAACLHPRRPVLQPALWQIAGQNSRSSTCARSDSAKLRRARRDARRGRAIANGF